MMMMTTMMLMMVVMMMMMNVMMMMMMMMMMLIMMNSMMMMVVFDDDDDDVKKQKDWVFTNQQRRQHFKRKIESLQKELKKLDHERYELDTERSGLTNMMKQQQVKKMNYQLERDRVKSFTGGIVTSSVLSGAPMQYVFGDFMKKVDRAILDCEGTISEGKFAVIAVGV
jgi:septal ring factor EnvC (AmiA/AmiB activator)